MFSSFSSYVWGSPEGVQPEANNAEVLYDDSKVTDDDWVLVEEIKLGSGSKQDGRVSSLQTLFEENEPAFSETTKETNPAPGNSSQNDNTDLGEKSSLGILIPTKQSDGSDKSSLEILFADAHSSENEDKDISDISMKTDETDFDTKTSLQFLFDESLQSESTNAGNNSASLFTLKPLPDPPIVLAPNTGQSRPLYNRSYSADYYRGDPEVVIEPTALRRRHVTRLSKRSSDSTALVGNVVLQKKTKQPPGPEGTSGVGRGEETRRRTRRANSVACGQNDNTYCRRRKRTASKFSGKGGRRNC